MNSGSIPSQFCLTMPLSQVFITAMFAPSFNDVTLKIDKYKPKVLFG